jgi:hypothetical protein
MLGAVGYKTKKELKACIGKPLRFLETSMFGAEYTDNGRVTVVGPDAYRKRSWFANVEIENGLIKKVS